MAALVTPAASVVSELVVRGRESAAVLEALLQGGSPQEHGGIRELAAEILLCCDRALAALHGRDGVHAVALASRKRRSSEPDGAASQTRPKRRMRASSGSTAMRVEKRSTAEDGHIWRKYGQKEITHSKHPRLYFRCSYKHDIGCPATRQVQQPDDDLSLYVITYFGDHTCCHGDEAVAAAEEKDVKMQPFVINFGIGSATESSTSGSPWQNSDDGDGRSEIPRSSHAVCLPEGGEADELRLKVTKVETTSLGSQPASPAAAELSSSPDVSCASPAWDPLSSCWEWDQFVESSFDFVSRFIDFDDFGLYQ
ncbi:transcription factor WRKY45-2-like [Triticum urartu]|nr:transcription factor WRKY45-2-like [Triticum urartu]